MTRVRGAAWLGAPYLAGVVLLVVLPTLAACVLAFTDYSGVSAPAWVGTANFRRMVEQAPFWQAVGNTVVYLALAVPLRLAMALGLALLLARSTRGVAAARTAAYLPTVIPDVAYALLWLWLLNPLYGPIAAAAASLGVDAPRWLTDPWAARVAIALMGAFQVGETFVVLMAWRRALPSVLYDSAAVDGAGPWFTFRRVTLPLMAPVLLLLALRDAVAAVQLNFVPTLLVTEGGPQRATTTLSLYLYETAYRYFRLGYAAAVSMTILVVAAATVAVQYRVARRWRLL